MNRKKTIIGIGMLVAVVAGITGVSAFEAHVINVTAKIENALFVHPESLVFGTVFPQEYFESSFFMSFSNSFSEASQKRVGRVDYAIKQKPKPREDRVAALGGVLAARDWCHNNAPADPSDLNDPYYGNCYPNLCPYLSKHPDNLPSTGANANNDVGLPAFHDPDLEWATGTLVKFNANGTTTGNDPGDFWTIDLPVPCFDGQCAQDWDEFVWSHNPDVADPDVFKAPAGLISGWRLQGFTD
jgi:hypothetical protein